MFGIEVHYKNGGKDWYDPCTKEPVESDGKIQVETNTYSYELDSSEVEKWTKYELCKVCEYDKRTFGCTDSMCIS